jgi:hypothetical protein
MSDFDTLVGQVERQEPFRLPVRLVLDSGAYTELQRLEGELEKVLLGPDDDDVTTVGPEALADQIGTLLRDHRPAEFVFQAVSGVRWDDLVAKHPGTGADVAPSFWPAVMAECCVAPEGATVDGFVALVGDGRVEGKLNSGQRETLIQGVREVNRGLTDLRPSFAATTLIRGTRRNSTTSVLEGSLEAVSSDG